MKPASLFSRSLRDCRRLFRSTIFAGVTMAIPAVSAYDCKILPDDVIVFRAKGEETPLLKFSLLVHRTAADSAPFSPPENLRVRVTSGDFRAVADFALDQEAGGVSSGRDHAEYHYRGNLPSSARGPTLLEIVDAGSFPAARTLVSVVPAPVPEKADKVPVQMASAESTPPATLLKSQARKVTFKAMVPEIQANEPVYFTIGAFRGGIHRLDARFQLSLKYRFTEENEKIGNLGAAITTTSLWDLHSYSVPFRDSTYRPAVLWIVPEQKKTDDATFAWSADIGIFEHESNGRGPDPDQPLSAANNDSLSRSMNRSYLRPIFTWDEKKWGIFSVSPKIFVPFLVSKGNSDIAQYRGYADLLLKWTSQKDRGHLVSLLAREGTRSGRHFVELDYGLPLRVFSKHANGWILSQWLYGYGETLRDYRTRNPGTLRIGLMIVP